MAAITNNTWADCLKKLEDLTSKPENYLRSQTSICNSIKQFIKQFYDISKEVEEVKPSEALPQLVIENFDDEQVWQQIELQNNEKLDSLVSQVSKLISVKQKLSFPLNKPQILEHGSSDEDRSCRESAGSLSDSEDAHGEDEDELPKQDGEHDEESSAESYASLPAEEHSEFGKPKAKKFRPTRESTIVDDKFFKLRDMEQFLEQEERVEDGKDVRDNEYIDYFADDPSSDDDEAEDPDDEEGESYGLHYKDFFDPVEGEGDFVEHAGESSEEEELSDEDFDDQNSEAKKKKGVRFMESSSEESNDEENEVEGAQKSNFETRQERLKERIDQIHEEALGDKPWQLQGEVTATTRPQNSLLEEVLQFDITSRPAPVITERTTLKLEDIIRQRIKDKVWDDVERKVKPVETPAEYKKTLVLDQEKSKLSLSQIYEQEYLKKQKAVAAQSDDETEKESEKETPEQIEIKKMMHSLFSKLDALANYHYTPTMPAPEIKIISNLPAITVEEVAPVATSDATLLAPEEIKAKPRGALLGSDERSHTDKRRDRRRKKRHQKVMRLKEESKQKAQFSSNPDGAKKMTNKQAAKHIEKATKEGKIKQLEDSGRKTVKSSTAFFNQLQDEVTSHIKDKSQGGKRKKPKDKGISVKKLKM